MPDIASRFNRDTIVLDGAMGSLLLAQGIEADEHPMFVNILEPELVETIHKRYLLAGAQAITTNSFSGSRVLLAQHGLADRADELNRASVRIAKSCKPEHVIADVGPSGLFLSPYGDASFSEVFAVFAEQIGSLASEQPDAILIETMIDIAEARIGVMAAKSVCDLPVFVSVSFDETGHMPLSGTDPATAAVILEAAGADVVGINCSLGPAMVLPLIEEMAGATSLPLLVQPNAGLPKTSKSGIVSYDATPDEMAEAAWAFRQLGVQFIGSCCGSTPSHTAAIYTAVGATDTVRPRLSQMPGMLAASPQKLVRVTVDGPCTVIGERINPTNMPKLLAGLSQGDLSEALSLAIDQSAAGADLLDINTNSSSIDAKDIMAGLANELAFTVKTPLVLDCLDTEALEAALQVYPGRAVINSVNAGETSLLRILPLAQRYGAAVIGMLTDGRRLPESVEERLELAERIIHEAKNYGLGPNDLLFDVLALALVASPNAREDAIQTILELRKRRLLSVLAISNISYKLNDKSTLNADFAREAVEAGVSALILNPNDETVMAAYLSANEQRQADKLHPLGPSVSV
ncbi:MAG: homocysteine S-methyltransferase family protein [Coriobacteriia bacterium]|nr:homocysteine S-methyltransferase family protein [Coriobacteriia bacterium]